MQIWFDVEDMDAAIAELDAVHARFEEERSRARRLENAASRAITVRRDSSQTRDWDDIGALS